LDRRVQNLHTTLSGNPRELDDQIAFNAKVALRIISAVHQQYLPLLHAGSQRNEYLIHPSIERAVELFTEDSFELTLVPDFEYNYGFVGKEHFGSREIEQLEKHSDQNTKAALTALRDKSSLKRWITFLYFPVADRDSALNLCVLAHELGHFVDRAKEIYQKLLPIELDETSFDELVEARCKAAPFGIKPKPGDKQLTFETIFTKPGVQARCYLSCTEMLEKWIREIIADVLAVHAIGPASYFAFHDFLACVGAENVASSSHPASAFRLQLMLEELKETMGYMNSSNAINSVLADAMLRVQADASTDSYNDEARVVHKTIEKNLSSLLAKIRSVVSNYSFSAQKYQDSVPAVLDRLRSGIAPIEVFDAQLQAMVPASMVAILNAGWELYKTDVACFYDQFSADVPQMERLVNLNHLLFKAVEASEVFRRWK